MSADCIFCNIVKGFERTEMVLEGESFVAFRDQYPKADTHLLVIPREHHEHLDAFLAAEPSGADALFHFLREVTDAANVTGSYRLLTNCGADAGQVIGHLHFHVLAGELAAF